MKRPPLLSSQKQDRVYLTEFRQRPATPARALVSIQEPDAEMRGFGGDAASTVKRQNPRERDLTAGVERKAMERPTIQLLTFSMIIESVSFSKADLLDQGSSLESKVDSLDKKRCE